MGSCCCFPAHPSHTPITGRQRTYTLVQLRSQGEKPSGLAVCFPKTTGFVVVVVVVVFFHVQSHSRPRNGNGASYGRRYLATEFYLHSARCSDTRKARGR